MGLKEKTNMGCQKETGLVLKYCKRCGENYAHGVDSEYCYPCGVAIQFLERDEYKNATSKDIDEAVRSFIETSLDVNAVVYRTKRRIHAVLNTPL